MGCGEKTAIHLVLSAVNAVMAPRVEKHVAELDRLIQELDEQARELLIAETDLATVSADTEGLAVPVERDKKARVTLAWPMARLVK